jgi:hypothetical protein
VNQSEPFSSTRPGEKAASRRARIVAGLALCGICAVDAAAQMPTVPVLQNGFTSAGMTLAINYGSASTSTAYALAAGWGPASQRFQISGALGSVRPDTGSNWTGYGLRAAVPLYAGAADRFGVALFAGVGGARHDTTSIVRVPVGVGVGYRFPLGETRSVSAYASPFFVWSRLSERGARAQGDNAMRGSVAVDLVLTRNVGLTAGYEFGSGSTATSPATNRGLFGAAVSYAFR